MILQLNQYQKIYDDNWVTAYEGDSNINDGYIQMDRERKGSNQE